MLKVIADVYKAHGPLQQEVPVRAFLDVMSQAELEDQLGVLLETGTLVAGPGGTVSLAGGIRATIVTKAVLAEWIRQAKASPPELRAVLLAGVRAELHELVKCCLTGSDSPELVQRAVELMGVLAMSDLDPTAIDVISGLGGTPRSQLQDLAAIPEGSCRSLKELQAGMRRFVTTTFLGGAGV